MSGKVQKIGKWSKNFQENRKKGQRELGMMCGDLEEKPREQLEEDHDRTAERLRRMAERAVGVAQRHPGLDVSLETGKEVERPDGDGDSASRRTLASSSSLEFQWAEGAALGSSQPAAALTPPCFPLGRRGAVLSGRIDAVRASQQRDGDRDQLVRMHQSDHEEYEEQGSWMWFTDGGWIYNNETEWWDEHWWQEWVAHDNEEQEEQARQTGVAWAHHYSYEHAMLPLEAGVPPPARAGALAQPVDADTCPASEGYRLRKPTEAMGEPGRGVDTRNVVIGKAESVEHLVKVKAVTPQMLQKSEGKLEYSGRHLDRMVHEERQVGGKGPEVGASSTITQNVTEDTVVSLRRLPTDSWRKYLPTMAAKLKMTAMERIALGDWQDAAAAARGGEASITPRHDEAKDDPSRQTTLKEARVQAQLHTDDVHCTEPGGTRMVFLAEFGQAVEVEQEI